MTPEKEDGNTGGSPVDGGTQESPSSRAFAEMRRQKRELEQTVNDLRTEIDDIKLGMGEETDPTSKALAAKVRRMEAEMSDLMKRSFEVDNDPELEPYMQRAMDENPELRSLPRTKQMTTYQRIARGLQVEDRLKQEVAGAEARGQRRAVAATSAHLAGSGFPAVTGESDSTPVEDVAKLREDLAAVKTEAEKQAIMDKFAKKHQA